ncbi:MAG: PAS domain S-box protein [Anaerolineales bacterium]
MQEIERLHGRIAKLEATGGARDKGEKMVGEGQYRAIFQTSLDGFWINDTDGRFVDVNDAYCRMTGYRREELLRMRISDVEAVEKPEETARHMRRVLEQGYDRFETRHRRKDGAIIEIEASASYSDARGGQCVVFLRDITERKRAQEGLRESERRLFSIYDTVADLIFNLAVEEDGHYRFASANPAFYRVTGLPEEAVVGKRVEEVIPEPSLSMALGKYQQAIEEKAIVRWKEISNYPTGRLTGEVSIAPVFDDQGHCTHLVGSVHDVTEREKVEEKLAASEAELRAMFASMQDVVLVIDNNGVYRKIAPTNPSRLYRPPAELLGKTLADVFPVKQAEAFLGTVRQVLKTGQTDHIEYELLINDRSLWFSAFITPMTADSTVWVAHDITERKRAEEERQSLAKFPSENPYPVLRIAQDGTLLYINEAGLELLPDWHLAIGRAASPLLSAPAFQALDSGLLQVLDLVHGTRVYSFSVAPIVAAGYANLYGGDITERKRAEEQLREKTAALTAEIAERERLQDELRALSLQDELTGLYNRRGFMILAAQHWRLALRVHEAFVLLYMDVDALKHINDTLGHAQGDQALRDVARLLGQTFRQSDILVRIGGDEFVVLLAECDLVCCRHAMARLKKALDQANGRPSGPYALSLSIGAACFDPDNPASLGDLLKQADAEMYAHKQRLHRGQDDVRQDEPP